MHVEGRTVLWIDDDRTVGHGRQRTVGAAEDLVDAGIVDDADAQHVGRGAELGG